MSFKTPLRVVVPVAFVLLLAMLSSCAAKNNKYGCPNHISVSAK
jgi:hypothetical protein